MMMNIEYILWIVGGIAKAALQPVHALGEVCRECDLLLSKGTETLVKLL